MGGGVENKTTTLPSLLVDHSRGVLTRPSNRFWLICTLVILISSVALEPDTNAQTPPGSGYSIAPISLTGTGYEAYSSINRSASIVSMNDLGQVVGMSKRFDIAGNSIGQDAWLYTGSGTSQLIGLTGAGYEVLSGGNLYRSSTVTAANASNQAIGFCAAYDANGNFLERRTWYYSSGTTVPITLTGTGQYVDEPVAINENGQAIGNLTTGPQSQAWYFSGTGQAHILAFSDPANIEGSVAAINDSGQAIGTSLRYTSPVAGSLLGYDSWIYDGSNPPQIISMTGPGYDYSHSGGIGRASRVQYLTNSGKAAGFAFRYSGQQVALGTDCWIWNGSGASQAINLTGSPYEYTLSNGIARNAQILSVNEAGQVMGSSNRYTSNGFDRGMDIWLYPGSGNSRVINLTGAEYERPSSSAVYRWGSALPMNAAGQATGTSLRFNGNVGLGTDTWFYDGTSASKVIGLTGAEYSKSITGGTYRDASPFKMNASGQVLGTSRRYGSDGSDLGQDVWFFDGAATTTRISLTGASFELSLPGGQYRYAKPTALNESGQIIGQNDMLLDEYQRIGTDGWFFDSATGQTSVIEFPSYGSDGIFSTVPTLLTDFGVVLGNYMLYVDGQPIGDRPFWWSKTDGIHDLSQLVAGGITVAGWSSLNAVSDTRAASANGSPSFILGAGFTAEQTQQSTPSTLFLLTAQVPEPAFPALVGLAVLTIRRRPRTRRPSPND